MAISFGALDLGMSLKGEKHLGIGGENLQGDVHQSLHRSQDLLRVATVEIATELQIEVSSLSANRYLWLHVKIPLLMVFSKSFHNTTLFNYIRGIPIFAFIPCWI